MITPEIQKISSLATSIKLADKELEKQVKKEEEIKKREQTLKEEKETFSTKLEEIKKELAAIEADEEFKTLTAELEALEKTIENKTEEKTLIADIDGLEKKIQDLEKETKAFNEDIEAIQNGTYNFKYADYELQDNPEENLKKREKLVQNIKIQKDAKGRLTVKTIQQLIDGCLEYYKPKYLILANRERKERRKYMDNVDKWIEVSQSLFEDIDKATDDSQKEFLELAGVDMMDFNNEIENYCKEQNHQILLLMTMIPQRMKSMLTSNKSLTKKEVKDIMKFQMSLVVDELPKLIPKLPMPNPLDPNFNPEKVALLVNNRVNDLMWQKFGVEEEDFIEAMKKPKISNDLEINQLAMQMEMMMMQMNPAMMAGMGDMGMGGMDMGGMDMMMGGPGGMGGFPPGGFPPGGMGGFPDMGGMGGFPPGFPPGGMGGFPGKF